MVGGVEKRIEPRIALLFQVLEAAQGSLVTRDTLIDSVWGGRPVGDDAINSAISRLRSAIGDEGKQIIQTVSKRGYRYATPDQDDGPAALCRRGEDALAQWNVSAAQLALAMFRKAQETQPDFARALAGSALARLTLCLFGAPVTGSLLDDASEATRRASEIDPDLPRGALARGVLLFACNQPPGSALTVIESALRAQPDLTVGWIWKSQISLAAGSFTQAISAAQTARTLDRHNPAILANLVSCLFVARDFEQCLAIADEGLNQLGKSLGLLAYKAWCHLHIGNPGAAVDLIDDSWRAGPGRTENMASLRHAFGTGGPESFFRQLAEITSSEQERDIVRPVDRAILWALANENEKAVALLELAERRLDLRLKWAHVLPQFDRLHGVPGFDALCRRNAPALELSDGSIHS